MAKLVRIMDETRYFTVNWTLHAGSANCNCFEIEFQYALMYLKPHPPTSYCWIYIPVWETIPSWIHDPNTHSSSIVWERESTRANTCTRFNILLSWWRQFEFEILVKTMRSRSKDLSNRNHQKRHVLLLTHWSRTLWSLIEYWMCFWCIVYIMECVNNFCCWLDKLN